MSGHDHEHEKTSIEEANGAATGFTGTVDNWNADAEDRFADTLMAVGRFVQGESGCLLGHIKAAIYLEDGRGITLNLIDMDNGVERHGTLGHHDTVKFNFMCAVLDVEEMELQHRMIHAIDDSGLDYHIDRESLKHHHDHDHDHEEGHEHHHHHDHDHEHGEGFTCSCGHHHGDLSEIIDDNGKLRADHHHHHDHDHDHEEGHEHHHDHDHEHGEGHCHCHHHD